MSQICLSNVGANHPTDWQCGMLGQHWSYNWSPPITLKPITLHHTLNPHIFNRLVELWKCKITPQKPNSCAVRHWNSEGDILGSGEGTTLRPVPPWIPGRQTEDGRALLPCGPLEVLEVKALFVTEWSFAVFEFHHQNGTGFGRFLEEAGSTVHSYLLKDICCWGNVRESDSLGCQNSVSVNQQISRQDVELFSLMISTITNSCPDWYS